METVSRIYPFHLMLGNYNLFSFTLRPSRAGQSSQQGRGLGTTVPRRVFRGTIDLLTTSDKCHSRAFQQEPQRMSRLALIVAWLRLTYLIMGQYIADKILKINERKRWSDPPPTDEAKRALQDEEIFQTAKLVNCGHFMSAIMGDYVAGFLGSSEGCNWNMNAFDVRYLSTL